MTKPRSCGATGPRLGLLAARYQILEHGIDQLGPVREEIDLILAEVEKSLSR